MSDTIHGSMWQHARNNVARAVEADVYIAMQIQEEKRDAQIARDAQARERQRLNDSRQPCDILVASNVDGTDNDSTQQNGKCRYVSFW